MKYKLEELCEFITDGTHQTPEYCDDGGVKFLSSKDVTARKIDWDNVKYIPESLHEKLYARLSPRKDDILLAKNGTTGVAALVDRDVIFDVYVSLAVLRPKDIVYPKYLLYAINSPVAKRQFDAGLKGVGVPNLHLSVIRKTEINIEVYEKQLEVCGILGKVVSIIDARKEELQQLDNLIKARFVELFDNCKNEVLIGDVISISRGASPRPISAFITDREDGVNWIKIGDVSDNSLYITKTVEKITTEGAKKSRMVYAGDFILSNSMSFGRPYILGINGCVHDGWLIMSNFKDTFNELYLYHAIRSDDVQYQFSGKVNGATVKNLNSDLVKNTYIKVPPMELQEQFASFVEQTDKSKFVA